LVRVLELSVKGQRKKGVARDELVVVSPVRVPEVVMGVILARTRVVVFLVVPRVDLGVVVSWLVAARGLVL
jgi:hypothetical protein